jgi:hypothetical protein
MSNYTKATNFATKDTLPTGDSGKIVKGTEIDSEFNAIASAVSSKADTASPTFTGTPAAPTAAGGTNTTQVATTAFVTGAVSGNNTTERTATATLTNKTIALGSNTVSGTLAEFNTAVTDANLTSLAGTETLTNKTIALGSNTVSGTKAQFNTAVTDTDIAFVNDFTGSNQSLLAGGYQKLPGGLIMQWGTLDTSANGIATVSYPISFPSAVLNIQVQIIGDDGTASTGNLGSAKINTATTTSFRLVTADDVNQAAYWFAVGY